MEKSGFTFFMGMDMLLERKVERMLPWIILLCIVGLALVFAEMLIPGFGVFGILGSVCLLGTAFLVGRQDVVGARGVVARGFR